MDGFAWLLSGSMWGVIFYYLGKPVSDGTTLFSDFIAWFVGRQFGRLNMSQRKQLEILDVSPEKLAGGVSSIGLSAFIIAAPFFALIMHMGFAGVIVGLLVGVIAGWSYPMWATIAPYKKWQSDIAFGLPAFVSFLPLFLDMGYPPRRAMDEAVRLTPEQFRSEMEKTLSAVRRTADHTVPFDLLAAKVGIPEMQSILTRLGILWDKEIDSSMLEDMSQQFETIRDAMAAKSTASAKSLVVGLTFLIIFGIIAVLSGDLATWLLTNMHVFLG